MTRAKIIGQLCKRHRRRLGLTQSYVAKQTGYTTANISSFETGRNNNMFILLWYVLNGLQTSELKGVYDNGTKL